MMRVSAGDRAIGGAAWTIIAFLLLPGVVLIPIAFGNANEIIFRPRAFAVRLFSRFFTEPGWVAATLVSLRVACMTTALSLLVGVSAAYALSRGRFAGRRQVDPALETAATIMGASRFTIFRKVTLPLIRSSVMSRRSAAGTSPWCHRRSVASAWCSRTMR